MTICGQTWSPQILRRIQRTADAEPGLSRRALSRRVCEWLNWRSSLGKLKEVSCRVALLKLQRRGQVQLPAARPAVMPSARRVGAEPQTPPESVPSETSLGALQPVRLVRIDSAESAVSRVWNELMNRYHYLGAGPLCGAQIRYLIRSGRGQWLGGLAFSAAAWRVEARDRWIGWSSQARRQHLHRVMANSRFLILPQWRVPHLASQVLGLALRQVSGDWQQRYGYKPVLVETFVEAGRFAGTCYRAANWIEVGQTTGRGRQDRGHTCAEPVKRVLVYPLRERAREELGGGPPSVAPAPRDWAEEEFGRAQLGDERLRQRLLIVARDFYARPQANVPQACQTRAKTKAAYRFFDHDETRMDILLQPHQEATRQRVAAEQLVVAVQDTTSLNYSTHPDTDDLGPITSKKDGAVGLWLHSTLAFNQQGTPLGLLDVQCWARDAAQFGKRHRRKDLPIEEKKA